MRIERQTATRRRRTVIAERDRPIPMLSDDPRPGWPTYCEVAKIY